MPPAPPHNVPVPFFYWQLQEPDAKVWKIISPWQGTSASGKLKRPSCLPTSPVSLLVVQWGCMWAGNKILLFQAPSVFRWLLNVEDVLLCLKDLVSWKLLSLSMPSLFLSWTFLLASDLTTLLLFTVASSFLVKGLFYVLHQDLLTFSAHTSLLSSVFLTQLQAVLWKT